jgi:sugar phosphate isomerase/epimerase
MLNQAGQACRAAGLQLLYHNHDFEFAPLAGGPSAYDLLLAETDPGLVKFEADLYWFSKARVDLLALFAKYPGRFPVWHFKDMDNTAQQGFAEVGTGVIDFKKYLAQAKLAGLKHYFVEQDLVKGRTELESAQLSLAGLKKLGL